MVGRVDVEHGLAVTRLAVGKQLGEELDAFPTSVGVHRQLGLDVDARARVAQELEAVGVAEQHPHLERAVVHRVVLADLPILRVRILEEPGLERIQHDLYAFVGLCSHVELPGSSAVRQRYSCNDAAIMVAVDTSQLEDAVALVQAAGELTLQWFREEALAIEHKGDGTPVTAADKAAERFLREELAKRYPDDAIIGEEEPYAAGTSGRTWVIDPIDGTKSFTHGVPLYSNLLALVRRRRAARSA